MHLAGTPASHLHDLEHLRQHLFADRAAAVLEQVQLRARAVPRFARAGQMLFTDTGLQQSTHPAVAAHHAERFRGHPVVIDLGCGLGSDTIALAQVADHVVAIDRDPVRLLFARHNVQAHGLGGRVTIIQADILAPPLRTNHVPCFGDPGRRTMTGQRTFKPEDYDPPLPVLRKRLSEASGIAIKVAPGISHTAYPWLEEVEIVSLHGRAKEAILWLGELATPGVHRRATILPSGVTATDAEPGDGCPVKPVGRFLYDPDVAVIRAGLVQQVATTLGLWQLDRRIAYLSGDETVVSPFVQGFEVDETLPLNPKTIRRRLRELGVRILEIKIRGVALDPDAFRRQLKLRGDESRTLVVTRIGDRPVAYICRRKQTREVNTTSHVKA